MSVQIIDATIHGLVKRAQEKGDASVTLNPRKTKLEDNDVLQRLCADLIAMYSKQSNSNGTFGIDPSVHKLSLIHI